MFLPFVLVWRKTRKKKPWTRCFIEEAWICRTGAIFRTEGGVQKKEGKTSCTLYLHQFFKLFSPRHRRRLQQTWFYVEATFSPKKWRLQVNICFYASETYKKVIYLNVNKSLQLFWCFQMRMRTSFVNLVRPLPSENKSYKWHLSHPIVYSCCCCFCWKWLRSTRI